MQELNDIDFEKYLEDHENRKVAQHIELMTDNLEEVHDYMINGSVVNGDPLVWQKTWDLWRARPSELTIWAGVNGNGKSTAQSMVAAYFNGKSVIASLEMPTKTTKAKMFRQVTGVANASLDYLRGMAEELKDKIYLYNKVGRVTPDTIRGLIVYSAEVLKVNHVFIDSLVKCGLGVDDYNKQKNFVSELSELAKEYKIHIHLVVHMRKGRDETELPDKFDIKGAGEITDLADNVLIVARNTRKQIALQDIDLTEVEADEWANQPDGTIRIAKNRHGEFDGKFNFWYDPASQQWLESKNQKPYVYKRWSRNDKNTITK
jgi:twinkle protein